MNESYCTVFSDFWQVLCAKLTENYDYFSVKSSKSCIMLVDVDSFTQCRNYGNYLSQINISLNQPFINFFSKDVTENVCNFQEGWVQPTKWFDLQIIQHTLFQHTNNSTYSKSTYTFFNKLDYNMQIFQHNSKSTCTSVFGHTL